MIVPVTRCGRTHEPAAGGPPIVFVHEQVRGRSPLQTAVGECGDSLLSRGGVEISGNRRSRLGGTHFFASVLDRKHRQRAIAAVFQRRDRAAEIKHP